MSLIGKKRGRVITRGQFEVFLKRFIIFLKRELRLSYDIPIILVDDVEFAKRIEAFGEISNKNIIHISIANRHPMDIFRTVAHEFVHYKQHVEKGIHQRSSHAGSPVENQANAKAGELLRKYGNLHPELFELTSIH
jgi:Zn-dependent peptidase ImmA (M78 family)